MCFWTTLANGASCEKHLVRTRLTMTSLPSFCIHLQKREGNILLTALKAGLLVEDEEQVFDFEHQVC